MTIYFSPFTTVINSVEVKTSTFPLEQQFRAQSLAEQTAIYTMGLGEEVTFLLDGGPGIAHYLWKFFSEIHTEGRLVGFDALGTGKTPLPETSDVNYTLLDDLVLQFSGLVMKHAIIQKRVRVIAHSFGAVIARLALDKVFSIFKCDLEYILIDPFSFDYPTSLGVAAEISVNMAKEGVTGRVEKLNRKYEKSLQKGKDQKANTCAIGMLIQETYPLLLIKSVITQIIPVESDAYNPPICSQVERDFETQYIGYNWIRTPYPEKTTVFYGASDLFYRGNLPESIGLPIIIPDAGHYSYIENPEFFLSEFRRLQC